MRVFSRPTERKRKKEQFTGSDCELRRGRRNSSLEATVSELR